MIAVEIDHGSGTRRYLLNNARKLVYLNNIAYSKWSLNGKQ